jgi:hypothetical protein
MSSNKNLLIWNLKDKFERAECKNIRQRERRKSCKSKEGSDYTAKTQYRKLSTNIPEEKELRVWTWTDLDGLIKDLNENLLAGLDPNPNLSRSKAKPQMYPAVRSGSVERMVFVGGSNAKSLSQAASMLGIDSYIIAKGGWKLTRENVDKLIPDLHELMSGLPVGTPIVLFCLDNSSFLAASEEGGMVPISKCVEGDHGYHVKGALVVAPE